MIEHEPWQSRYGAESAYFAVMTGGEIQHFVCKSPEIWSYEEADYVSCLLQDIFDAAANDGIVPMWRGSSRAGTKLTDLIDVESLAKIYWVNEILKNPDSYVYSSGWLFKDADIDGFSKITFGPAWDFDLACGNAAFWDPAAVESSGWWTRNGVLSALLNSRSIDNIVASTKSSAITSLRMYLDSEMFDAFADRVETSLKMNDLIWGGRSEDRNDVCDWLNDRIDWVERN